MALALRGLADDEEARGSLALGTDLAGDQLDIDLVAKKLARGDRLARPGRRRRADADPPPRHPSGPPPWGPWPSTHSLPR